MVAVLLRSTLCPNVDFVDLNGATTDAEHDRRFPGGKFLGGTGERASLVNFCGDKRSPSGDASCVPAINLEFFVLPCNDDWLGVFRR